MGSKNWTPEEVQVLKSAVAANPVDPHSEFASVATIVKRSRNAVNAKYAREYGKDRVFRRPGKKLSEPVKIAETRIEKLKKKKYNWLQRIAKRVFKI